MARSAEADAVVAQLRAELSGTKAALAAAEERARRAEELHAQAHGELRTQRDRHDASLSELRDQLAQLLARRPAPRAAKRAPVRKASQLEPAP